MWNEAEVTAQLNRILSSRQFATAPRLAKFLTYVVAKTLAGEASRIKEFSIALEVYERGPEYDPQVDSTVRAEATRLRNRLKQYYEETGSGDRLRISLPKGGYVPVFELVGEAPPADPAPRSGKRRWLAAGLLTASLALAAGVFWLRSNASRGEPKAQRAQQLVVDCHALLRKRVFQEGWPQAMPASVLESIACFQQAAALDRHSAEAWAGLAEANEFAFEIGGAQSSSHLLAGRQAADRAIELNPANPKGWAISCSIALFRERRLAAARSACEEAVKRDPVDLVSIRRASYAHLAAGDPAGAARTVDEALKRQPSSPELVCLRGVVLLLSGQWSRALSEADAMLGWNLNSVPLVHRQVHWLRGKALERTGQAKAAESAFRRATALVPGDFYAQDALARNLAILGKTGESRRMLLQLEAEERRGHPMQTGLARVYLALGETETALAMLEKALQTDDSAFLLLPLDEDFSNLRGDMRFQQILQKLKALRQRN